MKHTLLILHFLMISAWSFAQSADTATVGKIVYFEGKVEVGSEPNWLRAKINAPVKKNQFVRTGPDAMAEILWSNGTKTVMGPNSRSDVRGLLAGSSGKSKAATEGVFTNFQNAFKTGPGAKRSQEGGIRRAQKEPLTRDEIYWKSDQEITFDDAYALYEQKDYAKAIAALQAFLMQKPNHEMAPYAQFALGHSYIMSNNDLKAKEVFTDFVNRYPTDALRSEAEKVILKL